MSTINISKDITKDIIIANNENNENIKIYLKTSQIIYNSMNISNSIYNEDIDKSCLSLLFGLRKHIFNNRNNLKNYNNIITSLRRLTGGLELPSNINIIS